VVRLCSDQFHVESVRVSRSATTFGAAKCLTNSPRSCTPNFRYAFRLWHSAVWMLMLKSSATSFSRIPCVRSLQISASRDESKFVGRPQPRLPFAVDLLARIGTTSMFASSMGSRAALVSPQDARVLIGQNANFLRASIPSVRLPS
jgi:hypothetical protein